jgi:hypothetical protein
MRWVRDRGLSLVLLALFAVTLAGQTIAGWFDFNETSRQHGGDAVSLGGYVETGHFVEAVFENWESEFLQMAAFVVLTTVLVHRGSAESRRPGVVEPVDVDPRRFSTAPGAPWPVRRGGWVLHVYEYSLSLAFVLLFLASWAAHAGGGWAAYSEELAAHGGTAPSLRDYLTSSRFWFESLQNWQSEFLSIAAMVWLTVFLRQRWSPESKPVHAPHEETGR